MNAATARSIVETHGGGIHPRRKRFRVVYWLMWVLVLFVAPGPLVLDRFAGGFASGVDWGLLVWLGAVVAITGAAGLFGKLPGVEAAPCIVHLREDKPNPIYRRLCYTLAWSAIVNYALLNLAELGVALIGGKWSLKQIHDHAYFPLLGITLALGVAGVLPRAMASTKGEGQERRYFYGALWAAGLAQPVLGILWRTLPRNFASDALKMAVFVGMLAALGFSAKAGLLPRTAPVPADRRVVED